MVDLRGWGKRADRLLLGSADPFATRKGTLRAFVGSLVLTCALAVIADLIVSGRVDRQLWVFPVTYSVVISLIMRRRRRRRS